MYNHLNLGRCTSLLVVTFTYAILFLITLGFAYEVLLDKLRGVLNSSRIAIVNGNNINYAIKHGDVLLMQLSGHGLNDIEIMNCGATHCALVLLHSVWGLCVTEVTHKPHDSSIPFKGSVTVTPLKEYLKAQAGWVLAVPSTGLPPTNWDALKEFSKSIVFDPVMRRGLTPSLTMFMIFSPFIPFLTPRTLHMNNLSHMVCSEYVSHAIRAHQSGHWNRSSRQIQAPWSLTNEHVICVSNTAPLKSLHYPSAAWFFKSIMRHLRT